MKVLVVVDMQNDFIDGSLGSPEAQAIVPKVVEKISGFDGEVCVTMDTHKENYLNTQEGKNLPVQHCMDESHGWQLHPDIKALDDSFDGVFYKNAFGSTELMEWLDVVEPDEIVFVGMCTDICVISNAMMAKSCFPEVKITVDAACCAGVTPESHENALRAMQICQINIENWGEQA